MTLEEVRALLIPLALAMRAEFDGPTQRAYAHLLKDVSSVLVAAGLEQLRKSGLRFFPAATELQYAAEKARRQMLALHPWGPCCECEDTPKWRTVTDGDVKRLEPCPCVGRYRERLASGALLDPIADLPGETGVGENEPVYPTAEQLPAPIRAQLVEIAGRKLLK